MLLVEYLNQINLKSDMVVDELKRVSSDRDEYKKRSQVLEAETATLREEVSDLKRQVEVQDQQELSVKEQRSSIGSPQIAVAGKMFQ